MAKTLYIGNLPWKIRDEELKQLVGQHGQVTSARVVTDRETGRSRGFGFVDVEDGDVEKVISALNGQMLEGRDLVVNEARPKENRPRM
jgi:RNA recognition motif-containing protein